MNQTKGFSDKIIRIYLLGASILLAFYVFAFHAGVLLTENNTIGQRISIAAPFHFERFQQSLDNYIKIDPLLTIYASHSALPEFIQDKLAFDWIGTTQVLLEDEREFQVFAQNILIGDRQTIVYAVETSNAVEWNDTGFVLIEISIAGTGILLFLVTMMYMVRAAKRLAEPFHQVSLQLENENVNQFEQISPGGEKTRELNQMLTAINSYRARLALQIQREKAFTRYVSHELRTPMMIISGTVSNIRRQSGENLTSPTAKILKAVGQMQNLTKTFLVLARDGELDKEQTPIDESLLMQVGDELHDVIIANQIDFKWQLQSSFTLDVNPQLFKALIFNLLKNAFACSVEGEVILVINDQQIDVIDNGLGLDSKPRGYEGFGIGLVLVEDICRKYNWRFSIANNVDSGCTATINLEAY